MKDLFKTGAALAALYLSAGPLMSSSAYGQTPQQITGQVGGLAASLTASAMALQSQGQSQAAYESLKPHIESYASDPQFNYIFGLAAADSGYVTEAILAFQRVIAIQPNNAQARAELARAYAMAGDIDTARDQFNTVVNDPSLPDPVRQRFDSIVRNFDKQISGGGNSLSGYVDFTLGHDDNINAATDENAIVIPLFAGFGAGTLNANARQSESAYGALQGGVSYVNPISRQTRFFVSGLGLYRDNFENNDFDQASVTATLGLGHTLASRDVISGSLQAQKLLLDGDGFRTTAGLIGQYTKRLNDGAALSFSADYFKQNFDADSARDSDRYSVGVSFAAKSYIVSGSLGTDDTDDAAFDHLSYDFGALNLGLETTINSKLSFVGGIGGQIRRYHGDDPLFLSGREDDQIDISAGVKYLITDDSYIRPQLTYTNTSSNHALSDYDRFTASVGIRREF